MTTKTAEMTLEEIQTEMAEIQPTLSKAFAQAGEKLDMSLVDAIDGDDTHAKSVKLATMNLRLNELGARATDLSNAAKGALEADRWGAWLDGPANGGVPRPDEKNALYLPTYRKLASRAVAAEGDEARWIREWDGGKDGPKSSLGDAKSWLEHEIKTVMSTGAGFAPEQLRSGEAVFAASQAPTIIDLIPVVPTDQDAYLFMSQTTRTNNAAEMDESVEGTLASAAESAFAWTEVTENLRRIAHWVPATDQQLRFVPGMQSLLDVDMRLGVRQRLASQILNGTGTAPQIEGFYDAGRTGVNQHDATGENLASAVSNGIEDCRVTGYAEPDGVVVHGSDWGTWERTTTADGVFIHGHPSAAGPRMLWGMPVVLSTDSAAGSALVGAFQEFSKLAVNGDVQVSISSEHASYFIQGVKAVLAEFYATLAVTRESAFTEITNIGS